MYLITTSRRMSCFPVKTGNLYRGITFDFMVIEIHVAQMWCVVFCCVSVCELFRVSSYHSNVPSAKKLCVN